MGGREEEGESSSSSSRVVKRGVFRLETVLRFGQRRRLGLSTKARKLWHRLRRRKESESSTCFSKGEEEEEDPVGPYCNEDALVTDVQVMEKLYEDAPADLRHLFWVTCSRRARDRTRRGTRRRTSTFRDFWVEMNRVQRELEEGVGKEVEVKVEGRTAAQLEAEKEIIKDLDRIFPGHEYLDSDAMKDVVHAILLSYAGRDEEVGYCQGMAYLATLAALYLAESDAVDLVNEVMDEEGCNLREIYKPGLGKLQEMLADLDAGMEEVVPRVSALFRGCHVQTMLFATPWILTLYASSFPLVMSCRLVDVMLSEGNPSILVRVALAILEACERDLVRLGGVEEVMSYLETKTMTWTLDEVRGLVTRGVEMGVERRGDREERVVRVRVEEVEGGEGEKGGEEGKVVVVVVEFF
ncbi:Rab-GTPase-TBC domain-containing protein [Chloropicon primus]|nr:Rab-GTPase-TBC domain-containing protein [Chloropicon primus]